MTARPRVAVIGTGGTISSLGRDGLDLVDYDDQNRMLDAAGLFQRFPDAVVGYDAVPVPFASVPSTRIGPAEWRDLALRCEDLAAGDGGLAGIVVLHGTATMEEAAYFLSLTVRIPLTVAVTGAQRPANGISSDAVANLRDAIRTAADPGAAGLGVVVVMNGQIHAARDVTKISTHLLDAFRSPLHGPLGQVDGEAVSIHRWPVRICPPASRFDLRGIGALPRVDVLYACAGGDGALARAAVEAGAAGIVSAGFAPGSSTPEEEDALRHAAARGVVVVQATRAGGRVARSARLEANRFIGADDLAPHKARLLLALALAAGRDENAVRDLFERL